MPRLSAAALAAALASCAAIDEIPRRYDCPRPAGGPPVIDGRLDDAAWRTAPWTSDFVDIQGDVKPRPRFRTRAKMLWDDECFYVCALMEEPHVWGSLTKRDSIVYRDNDFEVFIDPDDDTLDYYEIEVNALNTVFDLLMNKPYNKGGGADIRWNAAGLRTAIHVDGTLNDPSDTDRSWSIELAIPWTTLAERSKVPSPPRAGDAWRVGFSRVQWRHEVVDGKYRKVPKTREDNWVWSPQGAINMHIPERWGYVRFVR